MFPYMGGKSKQAKWIRQNFPKKFNTYVEVFGGAFWVYLSSDIKADLVIYNDIDPMMYNLWKCIKDYDNFIPILESMAPNDKQQFVDSREKVKKIVESNQVPVETDFRTAKEFVYWLTHSFSGDINGGMSKVNNHISMLNRLKKESIQRKLDKVKVYNCSYEEIIDLFDSKETLFYVDPPYFGREHFYGFHPFKTEDHEKLSRILSDIKGYFVLSYYRKPEIEEMYPEQDFIYKERDFKRSSTSVKSGEKKSDTTELLILNFEEKSNLDIFF